jgi:hypothetical protein
MLPSEMISDIVFLLTDYAGLVGATAVKLKLEPTMYTAFGPHAKSPSAFSTRAM